MTELFQNGYALVVGVGGNLPVTVDDAKGLNEILIDPTRCAYPEKQVHLLTGVNSDRQNILDGLDWLALKASQDPKATVIFYFSGHGGTFPEYHIVPYGYDPDRLQDTAISGKELTEKLRAIKSKKLLVLLDCCHASGMAEAKGTRFVKEPIPNELEKILTAGSGRVVIASSHRDEVSWTGNPYSAFTQALREGLAGHGDDRRDGYAYISDIAMYVSQKVAQLTDDQQHPILKLAHTDDFAVAYYAAGDKSVSRLPELTSHPSIGITSLTLDLDDQELKHLLQMLSIYNEDYRKIERQMSKHIDAADIPLDQKRMKRAKQKQITDVQKKIDKIQEKINKSKGK